MENIKSIVADNIQRLRLHSGMTQMELSEKLNYSDKAVSKWERGEALPELVVLMQIAKIFGVTLDYLTTEHAANERIPHEKKARFKFKNHALITGMSILLVWLIATLVFVVLHMIGMKHGGEWLSFVYAVPVSIIVWLVLNSIWFNTKKNFCIISLLVWSILLVVVITGLLFGAKLWIICVLGVPGQLIIILWSHIVRKKHLENN